MSAENKNEAVASSDVSTRISQQLAELDEAYLRRAEKHIELLLAEKAAEAGDAEAQSRCGDLYLNGNGEDILVSRRMAHHWYMEAAKQGHVRAQLLCGEYYYNRYYPIRDSARAHYKKQRHFNGTKKPQSKAMRKLNFVVGICITGAKEWMSPILRRRFIGMRKRPNKAIPMHNML